MSSKRDKEKLKEIKEYAKILYQTVDPVTGKRQYSLRQIAEEIKKKFNYTVSHEAIRGWVREGGWDEELDKAFDTVKQVIEEQKQKHIETIAKDILTRRQELLNECALLDEILLEAIESASASQKFSALSQLITSYVKLKNYELTLLGEKIEEPEKIEVIITNNIEELKS